MLFGKSERVYLYDRLERGGAWLEVGQFFGDIKVVAIGGEFTEVTLGDQTARLEMKVLRIESPERQKARFDRNRESDITLDATLIMLFEKGQSLSRRRR